MFAGVLAVGEFRALWLAQILSLIGDQLARVALTVLVYQRTHSSLAAAVTFAMSVLPVFAGGALLSGLGDRFPRRAVMITCDVARGLLVTAMLLPGLPLAGAVALLFAVTAAGTPFTAARAALYPEILAGDRYVVGTAVTLTTTQLAQVIGFGAGGVLAGALGVRAALGVDAATFAASAVLIVAGVAARPAPAPAPRAGRPRPRLAGELAAGARLVFATPALRYPMLLGWLAAFYNAPEGVAAPLARSLGGGAATTGLLLAAPAFGYTLGALAFGRLVPPGRRTRAAPPLAVACSAVLVAVAAAPPLPVVLALFAVSGACASFQVAANSSFVAAAPAAQRSQAFGIATAGMSLGQSTAMVAAGAAAAFVAPVVVIGAAGALGAAAAAGLAAAGWPDRR